MHQPGSIPVSAQSTPSTSARPNIDSIVDVVSLSPKVDATAEGFVLHLLQLLDKDAVALALKITNLRQELVKAEEFLIETRRARNVLEASMEALSTLGDNAA